jgi:ankyrin repeat protein
LLPDHYVGFCEPIYDDDSYTKVIQQLAQATNGEWVPTNIKEIYDEVASQNQQDANIIVVEFDFLDLHFKWSVNQYGYRSNICEDFQNSVYSFAENHLDGTFIKIPTSDLDDEFVYFSKDVAKDFNEIVLALSSDEIVQLVKRFFELDIFGMMMLKEFVLQFDLRNVDEVDADGNLALNIAVQMAMTGKDAAGEVIRLLLNQGAKVDTPDNKGQTSIEIANGNDKLMEILTS